MVDVSRSLKNSYNKGGHRVTRKLCNHVEVKSVYEVNRYYADNLEIKALGSRWGVIRISYPEGIYDGHYVFAVISERTCSEVDIPRVVLSVDRCSEIQKRSMDNMQIESQSVDLTGVKVSFAEHLFVNSYSEVLVHFKNNIKDVDEAYWQIFLINYGDKLPDDNYRNCYVFMAVDIINKEEIKVPRAVLPMRLCSVENVADINKIESLDDTEDDEDSFELDPRDKIN